MASTLSIPTTAGSDTEIIATVTAAAYTAGNVIGGVLYFPKVLAPSFRGVIQSLMVKFKASNGAGNFTVAIFGAQPTGTFNDKAAPVIAPADTANLLGMYTMSNYFTSLGTHAIYQLDTFGHAIIAPTQDLWLVVIASGTPTPASASDMSVRLGINW